MSEWQPIETAPDDGSHFVAWFTTSYGGFAHICAIDKFRGERRISSTWAYYSEAPDMSNVTHWMPLPKPPKNELK